MGRQSRILKSAMIHGRRDTALSDLESVSTRISRFKACLFPVEVCSAGLLAPLTGLERRKQLKQLEARLSALANSSGRRLVSKLLKLGL